MGIRILRRAIHKLTPDANPDARPTFDFACTACREETNLAPFEKRLDLNGRLCELWMCLNCHSVLNATDLRRIRSGDDDEPLQAMSSDQFYAVDEEFLDNIQKSIDEFGMIDFLIKQCPDLRRDVFVDFGAGRGLVAAAASKWFDRVYAAELSLNVLRVVHERMPNREKIILTDDFMSISEGFDVIASMHVLEHLPNMRDLLDLLVSKLNPGGAIFFQVPMLRRDYIVNVHYTFFNEVSARTLARELGLTVTGVWFDTNLDFLTCIFRKPEK